MHRTTNEILNKEFEIVKTSKQIKTKHGSILQITRI